MVNIAFMRKQTMRSTLDFAPLLRSSIGFENLNRLVDFARGDSDA
jgi:molecular chaperone IbpA